MTTEAITKPVESSFDELVKNVADNPDTVFQANFLDVKLFEDYVELDLGNNIKKSISYPDFRSILNKAVTERAAEVVNGILPPSNMIFFSQSAKEIKLTCYYPSSIRNLQYHRDKFDIVTPNMIISHSLKKDGNDWIVQSSQFFCTDQPITRLPRTFINEVDHNKRIYLSALSNTYADTRMCYGNNSMPVRFKDDNLRGLDYYYRFLWETPFNDDLGIAAARGHGVADWYSLLRRLAQENKAYPYEKLNGWTKNPDGVVTAAPAR